jgi:hypothetical protein
VNTRWDSSFSISFKLKLSQKGEPSLIAGYKIALKLMENFFSVSENHQKATEKANLMFL